MAYRNSAQIMGNLGRDPDYRGGDGKQPMATLSVATTRRYRGQNEQILEETEWHRVVVYGNSATACQKYLRKGSPVFVEGRIRSRKYTDQQGIERLVTEIIASDVQFLPNASNSGSNGGGAQQSLGGHSQSYQSDDYVPF